MTTTTDRFERRYKVPVKHLSVGNEIVRSDGSTHTIKHISFGTDDRSRRLHWANGNYSEIGETLLIEKLPAERCSHGVKGRCGRCDNETVSR